MSLMNYQSNKTAPIALFAYARKEHLHQSVQSLLLNPQSVLSSLYVFCDGPATEKIKRQTEEVRAYVDVIQGFKSVTRIYSDANLGLARSIINGVSYVLERHGCVIVMEDDLVVSPHFLSYMNQGLQMYADEPRVASIHGYCYPVDKKLPETFFLRGADCWGWATWQHAWRHFESDGQALLDRLNASNLINEFDYDGAYSYSGMLRNQIVGKNSSWAIRWHASCFLRNLLTLYPAQSLVNNIGNDGSGTHSSPTHAFDQITSTNPVFLKSISVVESKFARDVFVRYFRKQHSFSQRVFRKLRAFTRSI